MFNIKKDNNLKIDTSGVITTSWLSIAFIGLLFALVLIVYMIKFGFPFDKNAAEWGQIGDFFGGMFNPILTFFSILLIIFTMIIQIKELTATREELSLSRKAYEEQVSQLQMQLMAQRERDKIDLTCRMLERWSAPQMIKSRNISWDYFSNYKTLNGNYEGIYPNLKDMPDRKAAFDEVSQFLSDLNNFSHHRKLDQSIFFDIFYNTVYPWFNYIDIYVSNYKYFADASEDDYEIRVFKWYETQVAGLRHQFVEGPNLKDFFT